MSQNKKYSTITADPPWSFHGYGTYGPARHYDLMSLDRLKAMPIKDLAEDNAHCWLWCTAGSLRYGYEVLESWGFTPRSIFVWIKPRYTLGVYLRNQCEYVLLGTRGKAPVLFKSQPNVGYFPIQEHSRKPEEFHKIVERVSPGPYLELFARRKYPGWSVWGLEVPSDIEIPGYPVPDSPSSRKAGENE